MTTPTRTSTPMTDRPPRSPVSLPVVAVLPAGLLAELIEWATEAIRPEMALHNLPPDEWTARHRRLLAIGLLDRSLRMALRAAEDDA